MIDRPYDYLKCTYSHLDYDSLQVLEGWSVKALMNRFDKRSLQMQIDTHKLFLLTSLTVKLHCLAGWPTACPGQA